MTVEPPFSVFLIAALATAAVGVAIWREIFRGRRKLHPRWLHPACLLFRIGAIAALAILLLNPSRPFSMEKTASQSVILLDASSSMSLAADEENRSRWEAASAFAKSALAEMNGAELGEPRLTTFSGELDIEANSESPAGRETNLAGALERLLAGSAAEAPDQIIVLSDGRIHDRERLDAALAIAKAARVPISTGVFGIDRPPRNASLATVQSPRMVRARSPVSVPVDIAGTGIGADELLNLKLRDDTGKVLTETDFHLSETQIEDPGNPRLTEQILVFDSGLRTGRYHLKLTTPGEPEIDLNDNRFSFSVEIASAKLRVLFVEGAHSKRPIGKEGHFWNDFEFMTRSWDATGEIEYECLTPVNARAKLTNLVGVTFHNGEMLLDPGRHFPSSREELYRFDVILISDVRVECFSEEQMQWVVDWIEQRGAGFLMAGGLWTFDSGFYDKTPWERLVPVDMKAYGNGVPGKLFQIDIPESVRSHPLWTISPDSRENDSILKAHPRFEGMNRVRRAKPGAVVLAVRRGTDEPVIAAQRYGRGRTVAYLPDPNGSWGRTVVGWGPPGGPVMGDRIHLGQGPQFEFNEAAASFDGGSGPPHPGPWYGQYWANMVRWLGENSVRWQRDKLAGRVVAAQARPGEPLPVAAEVLPVTEVDQLLALDVGARLDLPGSRRVRLLYDRDRREFTGELSVPLKEEEEPEIGVLFDFEVNGETWSQAVSVGIHRGNPEFQQTAPDPVFLADLARATKGTVLETVEDAVRSSREAAENRSRESLHSWSEPQWSKWWPWAVFAVLFSLEWALRRRGGQHPVEVGEPDSAVAAEISRTASFVSIQSS